MNYIFMALDAEAIWATVAPIAWSIIKAVLIALVLLIVGKKVIGWILKLLNKAFAKANVEAGVAGFVCSVVKVLLYFVLIMMLANVVGIETTSIMALVGSAGLTVGLALQGSLSNFAGGVLILILKPFTVGDYIVAQGCEGNVVSVDLFYTKIKTLDNRVIVLPNGTLSNGSITNVTREPDRRLDLIIPIGYSDDIREVKALLQKVAEKHQEQLLAGREVTVMVGDFGDDAIEIAFRVWVRKEDYWTVRAALLEDVKYTFDEHNITIPFHQLDVFMKQN